MPQDLEKDVLKHLPAPTPETLRKFLQGFLKSIPGEDRAMIEPASLAETALLHLKLSRERKPGQSKIHIRTPKAGKDGKPAHTVIDIVNDDMPFLVDSVAAEITTNYKLIRILLHPMLHARLDSGGKFLDLTDKAGENTLTQSHMHIELQGTLPLPTAQQLEKDLMRVLSDVHYATRDWQQMRQKLVDCQKALANGPDAQEYLSFLDYLHKDNFTLLGYREYKFHGEESKRVPGKSLGLLHEDIEPPYIGAHEGGLPMGLKHLGRSMPPLTVAKINKRSTVHRPVPMDAIAVKQFDKSGKAVGECLFIGLFTSVTYSRSINDIPLLRKKTDSVLARAGFRPGSHDHKAMRHVLEKYPRDELFQLTEDDLLQIGTGIMTLQERQRIALYVRKDPFGRYVSCLVYVPRDRYDTRLRMTIQRILEEEFGGVSGDFYTNLDDSPLARVMFMIYVDPAKPRAPDIKAVELRLQQAGQPWAERLGDELLRLLDSEEAALKKAQTYGNAFPVAYQQEYLPKQAFFDIRKIDDVIATGTLALDLYKDKSCENDQLRLKVFHPGKPMTLSDVLPVLENMGLRVLSEKPFEISPAGSEQMIWIHDFLLQQNSSIPAVDIDAVKEKFEQALESIWYGAIDNDGLNQLVLGARMGWREIRILRSYVRYMRQMGYQFGTRYIEQALTRHPAIARDVADLFLTLFDPAAQKNAAKKAKEIRAGIEEALEKVTLLDEDRILRSMVNLVESTLRTNYFQTDESGAPKPCLAMKMDSGRIKDLPKPVPYREIFVFGPRVEGVHLRGDVIARGGIRWSDRHEDFRTEVLGLMKAQQVKNSVIVPMGAKGGFVVKKPPEGKQAYLAEGIECYKLFISSLLDITDNRKGKKIVKPKNVVCRDGDDPYLVVAADKGTASFSDIANGISLQYGHWLGDAFASGGSAGYDHKKMGITARGAWESVKRHFRELGRDIQSEDFDVIGVGDMGGDVFGNGMLLSKHIRLIGAFNHMHIFCDPNPDTAATLAERKRLFKGVKGWGDYDTKLLSPGGRIYLRSEKSLQLTPEIRKRFDIDTDKVTPAELIQAMLRARTDLLWFGGIGTYVKATHQKHDEVGDRSNDSLRISAGQVRARVIGEGANLAVTQAARIEMSRAGVKMNADFIDNSGGVDSSDHEVNIKILMSEIMAGGKHAMTTASRNKILEKMTDEVGGLVLRNNYQQAQAISLMELQATRKLAQHAQFIRDLERRHGLDRALEGLPDEEEIEKRRQQGKGLTRPELAILLAHAKILFAKDVIASDIPDQQVMQDYWLIDYFPVPLRKTYRADILNHRLRREIIATTMANSMVNRMGCTFIRGLMDKTGADCAAVARAYLVVRDAFELRKFWDRIESLDNKAPAPVQLKAMDGMTRMVERETVWFLTRLGRTPDMAKDTAAFGAGIATLQKHMTEIVPEDTQAEIAARTGTGVESGLPRDLAKQVAMIPVMSAAFDIIRISLEHRADLVSTARIYFELGDLFHIDWLRTQARAMASDDRWTAEAIEGLVEELNNIQAGLAAHIVGAVKSKKAGGKGSAVSRWLENNPQARQLEPLLAEMRRTGALDLPMLTIAAQRLRALHGG